MATNSVANVGPIIEQNAERAKRVAHEIVESLKGAGTPVPVDHALMSFIYGFIMQVTQELMVHRMPLPTPANWMGYVMMSLKTLQIGAKATAESGGDMAKFKSIVERATTEFAEEALKAASGKAAKNPE